jgi:hypothetical protein
VADNIIRVVFEDNSNTNSKTSGSNPIDTNGSTESNSSPLNNTITPSESIMNSFSAKLQQAVELVKSLSAQTKINHNDLTQAASKLDPFDPKSVRDFNKTLKDATLDNMAIVKQFKKVNKSLFEFNKQLKSSNNENKENNPNNKPNNDVNNNTISKIAKTAAIGLPLYYAAEAFRSYAATNALDNGNNLMNPLSYASNRRGLQYEQDKSIASGIGALIGGALGSFVPGVGTAIGLGVGATVGSQIGNLGYSYFGGQDNARDQLQYEVSQNYTNLNRGNALSQQLASLYGNTFNSPDKSPSENMFLLPQFLQMSAMNQYGGNLSNSDVAGVAKVADRYNANPAQLGSLLTQINASVKDMSATLLNVDSHAQKTGGDVVAQLAVAVQLMQKGGLSAPDAINKAFNQNLYGTTYAGAQNGYFQSSYANQFRLRALGKVAGVDVEGVMQGDANSITKFNRLQAKAQNNRLNPDANSLLVNMISQSLGLGNGVINGNTANPGANTPYTDIFNKVSNPEAIQQKNYKGMVSKNLDKDLYGEIKPHNSLKGSVTNNYHSVIDKAANWGSGIIDKGKQYATEGFTHVLAKDYMLNMQQMELDKKSGNMAHYHNLEQLNKNLEQQIRALNKNTQAIQQKNAMGGNY